MAEIPQDRKPTTSIDKTMALSLLYWFVVFGIILYVVFAEKWPHTQILEWNLDDNGQYYPKMVFMETLLAIGLPAGALLWVIKKILGVRKSDE